jgi:hypothetical protein
MTMMTMYMEMELVDMCRHSMVFGLISASKCRLLWPSASCGPRNTQIKDIIVGDGTK